jgi:hypothetical protein
VSEEPGVTKRTVSVRFVLEGVLIVGCFVIIFFGNSERDDAAAWGLLGILVASIVRNLSRD